MITLPSAGDGSRNHPLWRIPRRENAGARPPRLRAPIHLRRRPPRCAAPLPPPSLPRPDEAPVPGADPHLHQGDRRDSHRRT